MDNIPGKENLERSPNEPGFYEQLLMSVQVKRHDFDDFLAYEELDIHVMCLITCNGSLVQLQMDLEPICFLDTHSLFRAERHES